jgi:iron complex outermembrane receptor protein
MGNFCRTLTISICTALLAAGTLTFADADARSISYDLNIPSEDLTAALQSFAIASHHKLLYKAELTAGKISRALKGHFTAQEAMEALLSGTGLSYESTGSSVVLIKDQPNGKTTELREEGAAPSSPRAAPQGSGGQPILLAQVDQNAVGPQAVGDDQISEKKKQEGLSEIVVTGTHIRGVAPLSPVKTITNQDLIDQGYTRLDEAIQQLPENFADGSSVQSNTTLSVGNNSQFNPSYGTGINLFGLGVGTTLVLLNGQRLAPTGIGSHVDISGIPTSAIDRVEIVEDGASALYGADAVGGVMNIITRKDYQGFETGARATGIADGKTPNYGAYALAGTSWEGGNLVATFDYQKDNPLLASSRSFTADLPGPSDLLPEDKIYRLYASATQTLTSQLSLSAQTLVPYRTFNSVSNDGPFIGISSQPGSEFQPSVALNLDYNFAPGWQAVLSGDYSEDRYQFDLSETAESFTDSAYERNRAASVEAHVNGPLFKLPGGFVQLAVGGEHRSENFILTDNAMYGGAPFPSPTAEGQRHDDSAYGERLLPFIGAENRVPLIRELAIDVAGRFDHYSDFGSSTNPKVTVRWEPVEGLSFHGTYTTSFRAPSFYELSLERLLFVYPETNPASPSGASRAILLDGGDPDLKPERSKSFNAGLDFKPTNIPGLTGTVSYFHFDYTDRIENVLTGGFGSGFSGFLQNAAALGPLITLNPTPSEIDAAYASVPIANQHVYAVPPGTPAAIAAIVQVGYVNAASSVVSGVNGNLRYDTATALGQFTATIDGTYFTKYVQQISPTAAPLEILNQLSQPLKFRSKGILNWKWQQLGAYGRVNYANSYHNESDLTCGASGCPIASWTTFDFGVSYTTPPSTDHRITSGLRIGFDVVNAFNRIPPYALTPSSVGNLTYDPINANPLQRAFAVTLVKKW